MTRTKSVWVTYAWDDNKDGDVDFAAQELGRKGLDVRLDRWNLTAGKHLWDQIEAFIQNESKSDAWLLYATQNSLGNEKCKEEYYYALDRALATRGGDFPIIALFPSTVDDNLIPAGVKSRLFVSLTDPEWKERIISAVEKREPSIKRAPIEPYHIQVHETQCGGQKSYTIELRPRGSTWAPFVAAIPLAEKDIVSPSLRHGPAKNIAAGCMLMNCGEGESSDKKFWFMFAGNEATPTQSYYVSCNKLPSLLIFGINGGQPQYQVNFQ